MYEDFLPLSNRKLNLGWKGQLLKSLGSPSRLFLYLHIEDHVASEGQDAFLRLRRRGSFELASLAGRKHPKYWQRNY